MHFEDCLGVAYMIRSTSRPYDRAQAMQWLADRCCWPGDCPDFTDETHAGRAAVIELLRKVCTAMRAAGIRGAWHYSLPLHTELFRILTAEEAQLAALREELATQGGSTSLPAISRGRRQRRAA
jgi:hypothetical protein